MSRRRRIPGTPHRRGGTLFVLPTIPDELDERTKNGLALRNQCALDGVCPVCGAVGELWPDRQLAGLWHVTFRHDDDCPVLRDDRPPPPAQLELDEEPPAA